MSLRATVFQRTQVGVETTPGTAVAANKQFSSLSIMPKPMVPVTQHRPQGSKYATAATVGKEHTEARFEGPINYEDLAYILASLLAASAYVSPFTFTSALAGPDSIKTLSIEAGSNVRAEKFAYGVVSDLELKFTQQDATLSGQMFGRALTEGATLTASPTVLNNIVVNPKDVSVWVGDTVAGLAEVTKFLEASVSLKGKLKPAFFFDSSQTSFTEPVELAPQLSAQVILEHNSVAAGYMADLRSAKQKFLRIKALGPVIGAGPDQYTLQITMPFRFLENDRADSDDIWASTYNLGPDFETGLGSPIEIALTNGLAGL
ncbi:MAG TPA: phage tail tube protein [Armatimonadota bacterium]|nr:phage tail tube protein [Armatimonadota bacterium]